MRIFTNRAKGRNICPLVLTGPSLCARCCSAGRRASSGAPRREGGAATTPPPRLGLEAEAIFTQSCMFYVDNQQWKVQGGVRMTLASTASLGPRRFRIAYVHDLCKSAISNMPSSGTSPHAWQAEAIEDERA
jgi:hypothetical protein